MPIKDKVVSWYIKNYLIPRAQIFNQPGFVIFRISGKTNIYSRQFIMPESFYSDLERMIVAKMGKKGKELLYHAGKKFGWRFATVSNVMTIKDLSEQKFLAYANNLFKFIEGTYASEIKNKVDLEKNMVIFTTKNFIICEQSGQGYFLSAGGAGGLWAKLLENPMIEGVHPVCQGRGNSNHCKLVCSTPDILRDYDDEVFIETNVKNLEVDSTYRSINKVMPTSFSQKSFDDLLKSNIFIYKKGIIKKEHERFFVVETSSMYLIEKEFQKNRKALDILYKSSINTGRNMAASFSLSSTMALMDLLTAFGWGDVLVENKSGKIRIIMKYFPWTRFAKDIKFIAMRGLIEGMLLEILKKKIHLKLSDKKTEAGGISLIFISD